MKQRSYEEAKGNAGTTTGPNELRRPSQDIRLYKNSLQPGRNEKSARNKKELFEKQHKGRLVT